MGEAERKRREAEQKDFSQELADRATALDGPTAATRPFDLKPDASTLHDLIVAVKELQTEFINIRHAVREASWNVVTMRTRLADLMTHGDIIGLRDDLNKIIEKVNVLPDEVCDAINAPPHDGPPPLAEPKG